MKETLDRLLKPHTGNPEAPSTEQADTLYVTVIFTSVDATVAALRKAGSLANNLGARITMVVPQIVPYRLPLDQPPVSLEFQKKRLREIASASPVDIDVQLYACRDELETLKVVLKPHSLIFVGGCRRFWPTREKTLARKLARAGHEVIFTEME